MEKTDRPSHLDAFMAPRSVAVIGASRKRGQGSFNVIENMQAFGYGGKIYPVNPLADDICGISSYGHVKDIKAPVDIAIVATPRDRVPDAVRDCAAHGIKGAIVVPQGFADADGAGKVLQEELKRISRETGIRILGPNTLGVLDAFSGFSSSFMPLKREKAPVGVICQSGVFFVGSAVFTGALGKGIDIGNGCDLDFADALAYFSADDDIRVIFVHVEGLKDGRRFLEAAKEAAKKKPVIALKAARTARGAEAAASHSGAMAGQWEVYEAAFRQSGIVSAQDPEEVLDYTKAFLRLPPMTGKRVGLVTFTGAGGIILIDSLAMVGLEVASLSAATIDAVKALSPPWMPIQNPLDIWPALMKKGMKTVYRVALEHVLRDPAVDGVICIAIAPEIPEQAQLDATDVIRDTAAAFKEKPVVAWLYGPNQRGISEKIEKGGHVVAMPSLPRAARTLAALSRRGQFLRNDEKADMPSLA
jgi:acyl-CoA synthetase (NDP forming)